MTTANVQAPPATADAPRIHITFLDSIRGLAAFYVVGFHIKQAVDLMVAGKHISRVFVLSQIFHFGHLAVDVFIVLSGFCLMIPVTKAGGIFKTGIPDFIRRRARRILPPYYAALVVTAVFVALDNMVRHRNGLNVPSYSSGYYTAWTITHVLQIQNFFLGYSRAFNGALWSVATEWQIYFVFAFALLPLYRKLGPLVTIALGFLAGLCTFPFSFQDACFWYTGLFAMGMASADYCFTRKPRKPISPNTLLITAIVAAIVSLPARHSPSAFYGENPLVDLLVGISTSAFIMYLVQVSSSSSAATRNPVVMVLSLKPLVSLGFFSYSLYLVHLPIINLLSDAVTGTHQRPGVEALLMYLVAMPICLATAYVFHVFFERPYMAGAPKPAIKAVPIPLQESMAAD